VRVAVITCAAYRDAWDPFLALVKHFWPDCPYPITFHSDRAGEPWCGVLLRSALESDEPLMVFQEDFFLTAPVQSDLVARGWELLESRGAGCVRLYPCPGAVEDFGDPHFGRIPRGTAARISCQVAIWQPDYLAEIARYCLNTTTGEAGDFENRGTPFSDTLPVPVLSFKREAQPWPLEYLVSGIDRGYWNPDAKRLCDQLGIAVDWSLRPIAA